MSVNLQHEKIVLLYHLFVEKSDKEHMFSLSDMAEYLREYNIHAERKSLYRTIDLLKEMGLDIVCIRKDNRYQYYLNERNFKPAELKLLIDTVASSKFISAAKSKELIGKIAKLGGENLAGELRRQVTVVNRVKQENESIFFNIDNINTALDQKREISFRYFKWVMEKRDDCIVLKKESRRERKKYTVIPRALMWDDENYYLVAYDTDDRKLKNFRVDRMRDVIPGKAATSLKGLEKFDPGLYSKQIFGMYGGEIEEVKIKFDKSLMNPVIDKFGTGLNITDTDDKTFTVAVRVMLSPQFFAWVFGFKEKAEIVLSDKAVNQMRNYLKTVAGLYEDK